MKLGDKITVTQKYVRKRGFNDEPVFPRPIRYWELQDISENEVMVIGKRTISNGVIDKDPDVGVMYEAKEYIQAMLVVKDFIGAGKIACGVGHTCKGFIWSFKNKICQSKN